MIAPADCPPEELVINPYRLHPERVAIIGTAGDQYADRLGYFLHLLSLLRNLQFAGGHSGKSLRKRRLSKLGLAQCANTRERNAWV
ncbi:MAG TPA: hypothetical protein DEO66_05925, partial [Marinobacter adhaerens]|nr:hypothetical protein [Marinobacter adhaerens]